MSETESYAIHRATEPTDICGYCAISKEIKEAVWLIGTTPINRYGKTNNNRRNKGI